MSTDGPEIVLNLWYVQDENGFIYSLRARAYIASGPEEEKLTFLRTHADVDYLIAKSFPVPERFYTRVKIDDGSSQVLPLAHASVLDLAETPITLFEDAIRALDSEMPSQTELQMPKSPVVCVTPLYGEQGGKIYPKYLGTANW